MTEEVNEPVVAEQPATEVAVVPEPPKEFRFEYQPTDEEGRPLGGKQVIVAPSQEQAWQKMVTANNELIRLNRRLNRDIRVGNVIKDDLPESAQRFDPNKYDLTPTPLTADELLEVSRDIQDPENFSKAASRIVKSTIGDPEALRARLVRLEEDNARLRVREEAEAFVRSEPEYFPCSDNLTAIGNWMLKNNLDPIKENFKLAYDTLADVLVKRPAPEVRFDPARLPADETPEPVAVQPTPAPAPRPVSSGLTRAQASDSGPIRSIEDQIIYEYQPRVNKGELPASKIVYKGREALDKMPGDEYRRRLMKEPGFRELVEKLDQARRPQAR